MPFDTTLAERVRNALGDHPGIAEKRMFGGLSFMLRGNLCVGILDKELIVRVGPQGYAAALEQPHARPFDFTGRAMSGWVTVAPDGLDLDDELEAWLQRGLAFVRTLPAKGAGAKAKTRA